MCESECSLCTVFYAGVVGSWEGAVARTLGSQGSSCESVVGAGRGAHRARHRGGVRRVKPW
jgi:hypothetical protein